jgi:hypothetical protein
MAQCHICQAETELYDCGLPICLECVKKRDQDRSRPSRDQDRSRPFNERRSSGARYRCTATPREGD